MKLLFKATPTHRAHDAVDFQVTDGEIVELSAERAKEILADFPLNFSEVGKKEIKIEDKKEIKTAEIKDKMLKNTKTKTK